MRPHSTAAVLFVSALALSASALSQAQNKGTPSPQQGGGTSQVTIDQDGYRFEVKLDPNKKKVTVQSLGIEQKLPDQLSLSLYRDETTGETYQLATVPPPKPGETPSYQGKIDWYSGPYVAVEIQVGLPNKKWKRFRAPLSAEESK